MLQSNPVAQEGEEQRPHGFGPEVERAASLWDTSQVYTFRIRKREGEHGDDEGRDEAAGS